MMTTDYILPSGDDEGFDGAKKLQQRAQVLIKNMLNEDPDQRPTVEDILGQHVMKNALIVFNSHSTLNFTGSSPSVICQV